MNLFSGIWVAMGILVPLWMTGYMGQSAWGALWFCLQTFNLILLVRAMRACHGQRKAQKNNMKQSIDA
ncbi:uncharacterized protein N7529_005203 [Penicillium soppii]|uniref:uncharacterized protein n=1 Tax=Penicillium soppii TaxID=69789 RepID=UPI002546B8B8|nr:uncharacterized protein N7529_005203 [Penicillium soppii]KAJ5872850.1 hypothetical protein N7529_005203 [Penicillium soppii]